MTIVQKKKYMKKILISSLLLLMIACNTNGEKSILDENVQMDYCYSQINKTLVEIGDTILLPNNIMDSLSSWKLSGIDAWTSGFWPGILWHAYENSGDENLKKYAAHFTELLEPLSLRRARDHDLGFQIMCSYGNAYRLTGNEEYKSVILRTADSLAILFNEKVGTLCSWPGLGKRMEWPHNTIIDNMMNLELLFWASKNGGTKELYDLALSHADITMKNHFRENGSSYHVAVYDTITGEFIKGVAHQGFSDDSFWARGQAWAIYGFIVVYRETGNKDYLRFVEKIADAYLDRLPEDYIPYWDFDAPNIPDEPRDASAAAIATSALLELSELEDDDSKALKYKDAAVKMLITLSSEEYQSRDEKPSFLLHCTGHKPNNSEVDASLVYADYYYIEALSRLIKINKSL